jgi:hypothetical protein
VQFIIKRQITHNSFALPSIVTNREVQIELTLNIMRVTYFTISPRVQNLDCFKRAAVTLFKGEPMVCSAVRKIISVIAVGLSRQIGLPSAPNSVCQLHLLLHTLLPLHCLNIDAFQKQNFVKSIKNWTELILSGTVYGFIVKFLHTPTL